MYNINAAKGKTKDDIDLWPFESDIKLVKIRRKARQREELSNLDKMMNGNAVVKSKRD